MNKHLTAVSVFALTLSLGAQETEEEVSVLDPMVVTAATRTERYASTLPQTVYALDRSSVESQLAISSDPIRGLSWLVPGFSPSREKITGLGETLRGREPLFLIDGVPQSNPLRNGSRDGYTIDPIMVERIEVINGASASQGMGATGGIINYVTRPVPKTQGLTQWVEAGLSTSDEFESSGIGYRGAYALGVREGDFGFIGAASYEWRGMSYDGNGNLIGVDNTQGDTMYSATWDFYGKGEYNIAENQSVILFLNTFQMEQELEYVQVPGDHAAGIPTTSVKGDTEGEPAHNNVLTGGVTYTHRNLAEGILTVNLFFQDFAATYGGGRFEDFQLVIDGDSSNNIFDQSENRSEKHGVRLTYARKLENLWDLGLVTGLDYLSDTTKQVLIHTGREWVPETTYASWSPFLQLDRDFFEVLTLTAGLRYESAGLEVDDYRTLAYYGAPLVRGGKPDFEETLFNLGATFKIHHLASLYGSYSQGFGMPDVGRVLRAVNQPDQDIDTFLNVQPIVTDNYELGIRLHNGNWQGSLAGFYSTADLGSLLVRNEDDVFIVQRQKTVVYGLEGSLDYRFRPGTWLGGRFAWIEGETDTDNDGSLDQRMPGTDIPAPKILFYWSQRWSEHWQTRLQSMTLLDRSDPRNRESYDFAGYTLVDLLIERELPVGVLSVGVENLLDEDYITYFSQTSGNNARNFAGRGRSLSIRYRAEF